MAGKNGARWMTGFVKELKRATDRLRPSVGRVSLPGIAGSASAAARRWSGSVLPAVRGLVRAGPEEARKIRSEDVVNSYRLCFGRDPESWTIAQGKIGRDLVSFLRTVFRSPEFFEKAYRPLVADRPIAGGLFDVPPPDDLKAWAASTLPVSPASRAAIEAAEGWNQLHRAIMGDARFKAAVLPDRQNLSDWDVPEEADTSEPDAAADRQVSVRDIVQTYQLLFGREPESWRVVRSKLGRSMAFLLRSMAAGPEFEDKICNPMLARGGVSGGLFDQPPATALKAWAAAALPVSAERRSAIVDAKSWRELHAAVFTDPYFAKAIFSEREDISGLWALPATEAPSRKMIPENVRIGFPLTERFFSELEWLDREEPQVSIVILSYNRPDLAENLIKSIWLFSTGYTYEVVLVDNGSPRGQHVMGQFVEERTTVIRLAYNHYLGDAYNIGVERAKGRYVVLMNNDIVVEPNWLAPLIEPLESDPQIGVVGPKFLYPTGQLQEAGALIDRNGYSVQRGKRGVAEAPEFNVKEEVDYCTGATMATRRDFYIDTLGYDWRWSPGYYEDVDLCFKGRDRGLKVIYNPESSVFHIESATMSEAPLSANLSSAIDDNRRSLVAKWGHLLEGGRPTPETRLTKPEGEDLRRFLDIVEPSPGRTRRIGIFFPYQLIPGGGEKYAVSIAEQFAEEADVYLITEHDESVLRMMSVLEELGFRSLRFRTCTLEQANAMPLFDVFLLIGNELFPLRKGLGRRNYFICQFPFPTSHDFLSYYHSVAYYKDYELYLVYSEYVRSRVHERLYAWGVERPVKVLAPTADLIGPGEKADNAVIGVGRFFTGGHNKRHDVMIEAMKRIARRAPELHPRLVLAGALHKEPQHREHMQRLREQARDLPIEFEVDIERAKLEKLYRSARVYWHAAGWGVDTMLNPEQVEHFGITVVEAMSAGCVPVVYAAGGPVEIVKHGINGVCVASTDEMVEWTIRILTEWDTPLIQDWRRNALETASRFGKSAFSQHVRELVSFAPAPARDAEAARAEAA